MLAGLQENLKGSGVDWTAEGWGSQPRNVGRNSRKKQNVRYDQF